MTSYEDVLVLFAVLLRFNKELFYPFIFNLFLSLSLCLYVVARLFVNTDRSTGCLVVFVYFLF